MSHCPNCNNSYDLPTEVGIYRCGDCGREYHVSISTAPPAVTHHCPNCEAAQRELADIAAVLRTGSSGDTLLGKEVSRWIDTAHAAEQERDDLRAHPVICGCGDHIGYAERIGLSQDGAICGNCATGRSDYEARTELDTLRARLAALCVEMETDDRAGKLAHWIGAIRALLRKEAK